MADPKKKPAAKKPAAKRAAKPKAAPKTTPAPVESAPPEASSEIAELRAMVTQLSTQLTESATRKAQRDETVDALTEALNNHGNSDKPKEDEKRVYVRNLRGVPFKLTLADPEASADAKPYRLFFDPRGGRNDVQMVPERLTHIQEFNTNKALGIFEIIPAAEAKAIANGTHQERSASLYEPDPAFQMQMPDGSLSSAGPRVVTMPGLNGPMTGSGIAPAGLNVAKNDRQLNRLRREGYLTDEKGRDQWSGEFGGYEESDGRR